MSTLCCRSVGFFAAASALALALLASVEACTKAPAAAVRDAPRPSLTLEPLGTRPKKVTDDAPLTPARSHLVGSIARKAMGPLFARAGDDGIAVWIVPSERGAELVAVPLGADGAPLADPRVVAAAPREATSLLVRPTGRARKGWLVVWSGLLDRGESLSLLELAPDGTARGQPVDLQRTGDHVTWVDLVLTTDGAVCLWAEETTAGDANILTAAIDGGGKPHDRAVRVARGVRGWAAARGDDAIALALVTRDEPRDGAPQDPRAAGSLSWMRLDGQGRSAGAPVAVGGAASVSGEVDMMPVDDGWLLAWTDRTGEDAQVTLAAIDRAGRVRGPIHAMNALGGSSLVGLASGTAGAVLAWEEPRGRSRTTHPLHLALYPAPYVPSRPPPLPGASVVTAPAAQPVTSLEVTRQASTELVALDDGGFALLVSAPACTRPDERDPCPRTLVPTYVRLDARLAPVQAEPLFVGEERAPAAIGWALRCAGDHCLALAAGNGTPTPVFAVDLQPRAPAFAPPVVAAPPADAPRTTAVVTVASGRPYSDLAVGRAGNTTLVATLTNTVDPPHARAGKQRNATVATVAICPFDDQGQALSGPSILTSRALAVGRVSVAMTPDQGGAAVAWVAADRGDPQVHVGRVDLHGRLIKDTQLTTAKGDASDVAIAWAGDGWLVAWVDSRDGNGEVYAAKVSRDVDRVGPGQRITRAPGDAADIALLVRGETAWLAWSDPRESPADGVSDIYATTLRARDATRSGEDTRVLSTAAHSRSPVLASAGEGVLVGWIEDAPTGVEAPGAAMVARLDSAGRLVGSPVTLPQAGEGRPTAIALGGAADAVHAVVARAAHDGLTLDAITLRPDGSPRTRWWPVVDLDAPASFDIALLVADDALYFDDAGKSSQDHRVRRAVVDWR